MPYEEGRSGGNQAVITSEYLLSIRYHGKATRRCHDLALRFLRGLWRENRAKEFQEHFILSLEPGCLWGKWHSSCSREWKGLRKTGIWGVGTINSTWSHCVSWFFCCLTNSKEKESILEEEFAMIFQLSVFWLHFWAVGWQDVLVEESCSAPRWPGETYQERICYSSAAHSWHPTHFLQPGPPSSAPPVALPGGTKPSTHEPVGTFLTQTLTATIAR